MAVSCCLPSVTPVVSYQNNSITTHLIPNLLCLWYTINGIANCSTSYPLCAYLCPTFDAGLITRLNNFQSFPTTMWKRFDRSETRLYTWKMIKQFMHALNSRNRASFPPPLLSGYKADLLCYLMIVLLCLMLSYVVLWCLGIFFSAIFHIRWRMGQRVSFLWLGVELVQRLLMLVL